MKIKIRAQLDYQFEHPTDILLQVEVASAADQRIESTDIAISESPHFARVPAQDAIGERIWLRADGRFTVDYRATVAIDRPLVDCLDLPIVPLHELPSGTVEYLMPSRYCPIDQFQSFVETEFGGLDGGRKVMAIRDWVQTHVSYVSGVSTSDTTAADTFIRRQGVCRDYSHVMITLVRAAGIPARIASVYALGVEPQDFHVVAEVYLGGEWHLLDATGMADASAMARIGIGRDAADVAFLCAYGNARLNYQAVTVEAEG